MLRLLVQLGVSAGGIFSLFFILLPTLFVTYTIPSFVFAADKMLAKTVAVLHNLQHDTNRSKASHLDRMLALYIC